MKLQQLRYLSEVVRQGLNVSEAADALHTSQPGVSKQIRALEDELGIQVFARHGKRLVAITEPGKAVVAIAERILAEAQNLRRAGEEFANDQLGTLTIAADGSYTYTLNNNAAAVQTLAAGQTLQDIFAYQATDIDGSVPSSLTVTINGADEGPGNQPPVITSNGGGDTAAIAVAENATAVTTVTATDADLGDSLTYAISGGADAARFLATMKARLEEGHFEA